MVNLEDGLGILGDMDTSLGNMVKYILFYLKVSRSSLATSGRSGTSAQGWATYELFAEGF